MKIIEFFRDQCICELCGEEHKDWYIDYCKKCIQNTNHSKGICLKCGAKNNNYGKNR